MVDYSNKGGIDTIVSIPPHSSLSSKLVFPTNGLQPDILSLSQKVADVFQCPVEFVAVPIINALSVIAGNRIKLFDGKYRNAPMHWIGIIAPSGSNKSQPMKLAMQPIRNIEKANYSKWQEALKEWEEKGGADDRNKPKYKQILIADSTPEARNHVLKDNANGICCFRDEIATKIQDVNRYSKGSGELTAELSIYDGDTLTINRKAEGAVLISDPFYSVMGSIQPAILPKIFNNDTFADSGYIQRWLWVFPDEVEFPDYTENELPPRYIEWYNELISKFAAKEFDNIEVRLHCDAKAKYIDYVNELQAKKRLTEDDYERSIYSKLAIQCDRWALSLHIAEVALNTSEDEDLISESTMIYAIECMRYFEKTALKVRNIITARQPSTRQPMGVEEAIQTIFANYKVGSMTKFADMIGVTKQFVSKTLKKINVVDRLTVDQENAEIPCQQTESANNSVNPETIETI